MFDSQMEGYGFKTRCSQTTCRHSLRIYIPNPQMFIRGTRLINGTRVASHKNLQIVISLFTLSAYYSPTPSAWQDTSNLWKRCSWHFQRSVAPLISTVNTRRDHFGLSRCKLNLHGHPCGHPITMSHCWRVSEPRPD